MTPTKVDISAHLMRVLLGDEFRFRKRLFCEWPRRQAPGFLIGKDPAGRLW
jgi:hypothetical protein